MFYAVGLLFAQESADPASALLQYGALGAVVVFAFFALRVMYQRIVQAYEHERDRADRLEEELRELNAVVRGEYVGTIGNATRAIAEATNAVAQAHAAVRRDGRRG